MLAVVPQTNLISNIGFGPDATHTLTKSRYANMAVDGMRWPLEPPEIVAAHGAADLRTAHGMFRTGTLGRLKRYVRRLAGRS